MATAQEIEKIGDVDRSEEIRQNYVNNDGILTLTDFVVTAPPWSKDRANPNSVNGYISEWRPYLDEGGTMIATFDSEKMRAFIIYKPDLAPNMAQLAVLHVSLPYRRQGLGRTLSLRAIELARQAGKEQIYVTATPTRGTVEFYQSMGFHLTDTPDPRLLALEPDDIHMILTLSADRPD